MKTAPLSCVWCPALFSAAFTANLVSGQVVLSPVAVVRNDLGTASETTSVTNMINQSGITTPFVSGVTVFDTYFATPGVFIIPALFVIVERLSGGAKKKAEQPVTPPETERAKEGGAA